jgi:hypothetical protein
MQYLALIRGLSIRLFRGPTLLHRKHYPPLLRPYPTNQTPHHSQHWFSTISIVSLVRSVKVLSSKSFEDKSTFLRQTQHYMCLPTNHLPPCCPRNSPCFLFCGFCFLFIFSMYFFCFFVFQFWVSMSSL